jgi:hypothetical protein
MTSSEELAVNTRKIIASTKRIEDLDELDIKGNGSIYRMFVAGELTPEDAKKLIDQVNYRRINLLQSDGVISKSVKNRIRNEGGVRGIALLDPSILRGSDGQKAQIYKAAIQTSESSDELAQVYSVIQSDVTSPAYLDVLEEAITAKTSIIGDIEDVARVRGPQLARSTVDEESVTSANRALVENEARRAASDTSRPEFPRDVEDISPGDTIFRGFLTEDGRVVDKLAEGQKWAKGEDGKRIQAAVGGGRNRIINASKEAALPPPKNKRPWLMSYRDRPNHPMRPEFAGESTMDLILSGNRTGTTRPSNYNIDVGDAIDFADNNGRVIRVEITKAPYQLPTSSDPDMMQRYRTRWSELEGWDPSLYDQYAGQWQFQYKLLGEITN